ncbi:MAG: hypothetical protein EXR94_11355 [Gemmatimonadetes bacterium]|nr:hypothetical protein [Gemmatimonadota bacterium]
MNKLYRSLLLTGSLAAVLAGCGDDVTITAPPPPPPPTPPPAPTVRSITVGPDGASVTVGATLNMTAAVNADAGVATTVTWTSSDATKASVSATGVVTGVAVGAVGVRACSTVNTSVCGVATVTVVASPVAVVTDVTVTPSAATLVIGQQITATATVQGTNSPSQAVTWSSLASSIATVTAGGVVTGVATGVAVIKATSNANSSIAGTLSVTVATPQPATISIQSITTGGLNTPVTLSSVSGQIEVTLNVDNGAYTITKAQVLVNGATVLAEQTFASGSANAAPEAAPSTIVLSVNTRQVKLVSDKPVPLVFNGPNSITARIYVEGITAPISSAAATATFRNKDAFTEGSDPVLTPLSTTPSAADTADDGSDITWYTGNVEWTGGPNYVSFFPRTPTIEAFSNNCGSDGSNLTGTHLTGYALGGEFDCEGEDAFEDAVSIDSFHVTKGTDPTVPGDVVYVAHEVGETELVGSAYTVDGTSRYNLVSEGSLAYGDTVYIDLKAPTVTAAQVRFNAGADYKWIKASYDFVNAFASFTDGGSGAKASTRKAFAGAAAIDVMDDCDLATTAVSTGADLAETATSDDESGYSICIQGADSLGNTSELIPGLAFFGVDKTAPTARYVTSASPATSGSISTGTDTADTRIYKIGSTHTTANIFAIEAIDGRSGFHQGSAVVGFPTTMARTRLNTAAAAATTCTVGNATLPTVLADSYIRSVEADANCSDNAATTLGYYTWSGYVTDRAGNVSSTFTREFAKDDLARPNITALALGQATLTPGAAAIFKVWGSDDLEVIEGSLLVNYDNDNDGTVEHSIRYPYSLFPIGTRWNASLTTTITGSELTIASLIGRVDSVDVTDSLPFALASYATGGKAAPDSVYANLRDVGSQVDATPIGIALDSLTQFSAKTVAAWQLTSGIFDAASNRTWSGVVSGDNLVATQRTGLGVTAAYFTSVTLYGVLSGELVNCGSMGTATMADNGVYRTWQYSVAEPEDGDDCYGATDWYVGGVKGNAVLLSVLFSDPS